MLVDTRIPVEYNSLQHSNTEFVLLYKLVGYLLSHDIYKPELFEDYIVGVQIIGGDESGWIELTYKDTENLKDLNPDKALQTALKHTCYGSAVFMMEYIQSLESGENCLGTLYRAAEKALKNRSRSNGDFEYIEMFFCSDFLDLLKETLIEGITKRIIFPPSFLFLNYLFYQKDIKRKLPFKLTWREAPTGSIMLRGKNHAVVYNYRSEISPISQMFHFSKHQNELINLYTNGDAHHLNEIDPALCWLTKELLWELSPFLWIAYLQEQTEHPFWGNIIEEKFFSDPTIKAFLASEGGFYSDLCTTYTWLEDFLKLYPELSSYPFSVNEYGLGYPEGHEIHKSHTQAIALALESDPLSILHDFIQYCPAELLNL